MRRDAWIDFCQLKQRRPPRQIPPTVGDIFLSSQWTKDGRKAESFFLSSIEVNMKEAPTRKRWINLRISCCTSVHCATGKILKETCQRWFQTLKGEQKSQCPLAAFDKISMESILSSDSNSVKRCLFSIQKRHVLAYFFRWFICYPYLCASTTFFSCSFLSAFIVLTVVARSLIGAFLLVR